MQPIQEWLVWLHHNRPSVESGHLVSARRTFPSGGLPIIVVQHPAQPLMSPDRSTITSMRFIRGDQPVAETLMVALAMITMSGQAAIKVKQSPFPTLFPLYESDLKRFVEVGWIYAIMLLRFSGTVESVNKLELKMQGHALLVDFLGKRRKYYTNMPPFEISVTGLCKLK